MKLRYTTYLPDEEFALLRSFPWLRECGTSAESEGFTAVASLEAATSMMKSAEYENFQLDRQADLTVFLNSRYQNEYSEWNEHVDYAKDRITSLLKEIDGICSEMKLDRVFLDLISWDIMGYLQERVYRKFRRPGFYSELISVYDKGRIPCGYTGKYPKGNINIY